MNLCEPGSRWLEYEDTHGCFFIGGLLSGGGSALGGLFGFLGAGQASSEAADAQRQGLAFEKQMYQRLQNQLRPYIMGGTQAWNELLGGLGTPWDPGVFTESPAIFGGLPATPPQYMYQAPTTSTFQASPGYQFEKQQGIEAIQNAAGGRTGILGGNTLQGIQEFGTGLANQDWWNFLNNYKNDYNTRYAAETQDYWNRFNAAANTQQNAYNRFAGPASIGLQAATTGGQIGSNLAGTIGGQYNQLGSTIGAGTLGQFGSLASIFGGGGMGGPPGGLYGSIVNALRGGGGPYGQYGYNPLYAGMGYGGGPGPGTGGQY